MRYVRMLIVMTAIVFVAAGSTKGISSPGPQRLDPIAVAASALSPLPAVKGDESLSKTIFPAVQNSTDGQLFVAASAQGGKEDVKTEKDAPPPPSPPRSTRCPPDPKDDHGNKAKDKDHRDDKCGKGSASTNP